MGRGKYAGFRGGVLPEQKTRRSGDPSLTLTIAVGTVVSLLGSASIVAGIVLGAMPSMDSRRPVSMLVPLIVALAVAQGFSGRVLAQAPSSIPSSVVSQARLTPEQVQQVKAYAEYWTDMLARPSASPEDVQRARRELIQPLRGLNVSGAFRFDYSMAAVPPLQSAIRQGSLHAATNAMLVLAELGSDRAMTVLLEHVSLRNEPRWQIRLRAAADARNALQLRTLTPNKVVDAANRLREAAISEDNPLVLGRQLEALNAADDPSLTALGDRQRVRAALLEAVVAVIDRIAQSESQEPQPLIVPVTNYGVVNLRSQFLNSDVPGDERRAMSIALAPSLGKLLSGIERSWDAVQADAELKQLHSMVVGSCETFLPLIDTQVRGSGKSPSTQMRDAWNRGDRERFSAGVKAWNEVLSGAPYRR